MHWAKTDREKEKGRREKELVHSSAEFTGSLSVGESVEGKRNVRFLRGALVLLQ